MIQSWWMHLLTLRNPTRSDVAYYPFAPMSHFHQRPLFVNRDPTSPNPGLQPHAFTPRVASPFPLPQVPSSQPPLPNPALEPRPAVPSTQGKHELAQSNCYSLQDVLHAELDAQDAALDKEEWDGAMSYDYQATKHQAREAILVQTKVNSSYQQKVITRTPLEQHASNTTLHRGAATITERELWANPFDFNRQFTFPGGKSEVGPTSNLEKYNDDYPPGTYLYGHAYANDEGNYLARHHEKVFAGMAGMTPLDLITTNNLLHDLQEAHAMEQVRMYDEHTYPCIHCSSTRGSK